MHSRRPADTWHYVPAANALTLTASCILWTHTCDLVIARKSTRVPHSHSKPIFRRRLVCGRTMGNRILDWKKKMLLSLLFFPTANRKRCIKRPKGCTKCERKKAEMSGNVSSNHSHGIHTYLLSRCNDTMGPRSGICTGRDYWIVQKGEKGKMI